MKNILFCLVLCLSLTVQSVAQTAYHRTPLTTNEPGSNLPAQRSYLEVPKDTYGTMTYPTFDRGTNIWYTFPTATGGIKMMNVGASDNYVLRAHLMASGNPWPEIVDSSGNPVAFDTSGTWSGFAGNLLSVTNADARYGVPSSYMKDSFVGQTNAYKARTALGLPAQLYPGISDLLAAGEYRVAHRGGAKEYHPLSIMAFDHCLAANVPIVEIDTYPLRYEDNGASDGGIALHHGSDVSETSLTSGAIGSFTLAQWKLIPFDGGESVFFPHASGTTSYQPFQHPTNECHIDLDTFLSRYANKLVVINNVYGTGTVPAIVNRLRQYGVDTNHWLFMPNSTGQDSVDAYNSGYPLILLTSSTNTFKTFYDAHGPLFGAAMDASTYGASTIADFKSFQSDLKMVGFTATTDYDLKAFRALGYDMILADKPSWPGMTPQTLVNIGAPSLRFSMISIGSFGGGGTNTYRFTNGTFAVDTTITNSQHAFFCIGQASPLTTTNGVSLKCKVTWDTLGSGRYGGLAIGTRDDNFTASGATYKGMRFIYDASSFTASWYNGATTLTNISHSIGATLSTGNTYYLCVSINDTNVTMSVRNSSDVLLGSAWSTPTLPVSYPTNDCRGPYVYGWQSNNNKWTWDTLAVSYP